VLLLIIITSAPVVAGCFCFCSCIMILLLRVQLRVYPLHAYTKSPWRDWWCKFWFCPVGVASCKCCGVDAKSDQCHCLSQVLVTIRRFRVIRPNVGEIITKASDPEGRRKKSIWKGDCTKSMYLFAVTGINQPRLRQPMINREGE